MNPDNTLKKLEQIISSQATFSKADFNVQQFMELIVEEVKKLTLADGVVVELAENDKMVYKATSGTLVSYIGMQINKAGSISGLCVDQKEVLISEDTEKDPRVNRELCRRVGARSIVVAPLFHQGNAVGVIKILSDKISAFNQEHINTLQLMANMLGSSLANQLFHNQTVQILEERTKALNDLKAAEEKLFHMANYDVLTELPNRNLFTIRFDFLLKEAKRYDKKFALCFLDIDYFKQINDTLGHDAGDELLKKFAARIQKNIRASDFAARIGGDEFIILLGEIKNKTDVTTFANNFIHSIRKPFILQKNEKFITTSMGISLVSAALTEKEEILKQADNALYETKKNGRNGFCIFDSDKKNV